MVMIDDHMMIIWSLKSSPKVDLALNPTGAREAMSGGATKSCPTITRGDCQATHGHADTGLLDDLTHLGVKQYHKPPIWEWLIAPKKVPIYGDLGDGKLLFYPYQME